jgi:hypothetical protein
MIRTVTVIFTAYCLCNFKSVTICGETVLYAKSRSDRATSDPHSGMKVTNAVIIRCRNFKWKLEREHT